MRWNLMFAVACALPLAACSHPARTASGPSAAADAPPAATEPAVAGSAARCDPEKVASLVGKTATEAVVQQAVKASGARHARVLKPGMAMTMDFREDRLSLEVDAQNRIVRANCG
ncbi:MULTISPECIES: I78 family peptidase inhibitor [Stenotrophomonas]|jgi:hypothetical protein|uniref:Peptidase inhibitor I78 family protein n=1 Tax=Stenotrophomonas maltophilia TaxID=40324 RepID=A0A4S2CX65_STEMA|nr:MULTISPECIES: I78 family peptidase inhibitor [Stenotrophomonas]MBD3826373.1 hypothetical protein [Stenotrophomonas sp.]QIO86420.1 hypothetical protein G9274_000105 [Stenotrophomonas rhizophila]TGY33142.1 hypothetical protein E5352_13070 [Stenotrophomonas maltophilia]